MASHGIPNFTQQERWGAALFASLIECGFFALLIVAGANQNKVRAVEPPVPSQIPIEVTPVLDDAPLLKLGGKRMRPKLPDLWRKS